MKSRHLLSLLLTAALPCLAADEMPETLGSVERLDPAIDKLIPADAEIEVLAQGFTWSEGPVWSKSEDAILFSDVPNNKVFIWDEKDGLRTYLKFSGYNGVLPKKGGIGSNGLAIHNGELILCQHGNRRLARLTKEGFIEPIVSTFEEKRFSSPNDLVIANNGAIFFTDPPYGLPKRHQDPQKELPYAGVYRVSPSGETQIIVKDLTFPNGIALSPNGKILYVAVSDPASTRIMAYDVQKNGNVTGGRVFFDAQPISEKGGLGLCDGLKLDRKGNLFATGPNGVLVIDKNGKHLGTINPGVKVANVAFGDNGKTLYMTSHMYLTRIRTKTHGL